MFATPGAAVVNREQHSDDLWNQVAKAIQCMKRGLLSAFLTLGLLSYLADTLVKAWALNERQCPKHLSTVFGDCHR